MPRAPWTPKEADIGLSNTRPASKAGKKKTKAKAERVVRVVGREAAGVVATAWTKGGKS